MAEEHNMEVESGWHGIKEMGGLGPDGTDQSKCIGKPLSLEAF